VAELPAVLGEDPATWGARAGTRPPPDQHQLLLFICSSQEEGWQCAAAAAGKGFQRTALLEGGLPAYERAAAAQARPCICCVGQAGGLGWGVWVGLFVGEEGGRR
jgi:hypothetical protein